MKGIIWLHKIKVGKAILSFAPIKSTHHYYKVKIYQNLCTQKQVYMVPFEFKRNVNKCKDAVLSHNCIKFTVVHIVPLW